MQRKIKFRGKAIGGGKTSANWVYGGGCFTVNGHAFIIPENMSPKFTGKDYHEAKAIAVCYLCQFTGVYDKNNKEIYESDVVRMHGNERHTFIVEWDERHAQFLSKGIQAEERIMLNGIAPSGSVEIIGNIYDNPELLK